MKKNILVIGGTYFAGRCFVNMAARSGDCSLVLLHRGHYSMAHLPNVKEIIGDRHDPAVLRLLPAIEYDAVVDFCAYTPGDTALLLDTMPGHTRRYLLFSTADVYLRSYVGVKDENAPLVFQKEPGMVGEYIYHKRLLESEARESCCAHGIALSIFRPAFLYGPFNYAPRESYYIEKILRGESLPVPVDADAHFQFVYVEDVARAVLNLCRGEGEDGVYNLAAPEEISYRSFIDMLHCVADRPFSENPVTVEQVLHDALPLPFPLREGESELYLGEKAPAALHFSYTPFQEGLRRTYEVLCQVYDSDTP